jgi:hypothetical protein
MTPKVRLLIMSVNLGIRLKNWVGDALTHVTLDTTSGVPSSVLQFKMHSVLEFRNWGDSSWLAELWRGIPPWKPGWRWVQSSTTTMCWGSGDRAEWRRSYRPRRTMGNRMYLRHLPSLTAALPFWITTRMGDNETRWLSCTASNPTSTKRQDDTLGGCTVLNMYEYTWVHRRGINLNTGVLRIHTINTFRVENIHIYLH